MKTAGLLLIVAAGLLLGLMAAGGLRRRVSTLGQLSRFMVRLADQIRYTAAPVEELLTAAESSGEFDGLSMLGHVCSRLRKGERVLAAWEGAVEEDGRDAGLTKADRELLRGFGSQLGRTDVEGQIGQLPAIWESSRTEADRGKGSRSGQGASVYDAGLRRRHGFGPSAVVTGAGG